MDYSLAALKLFCCQLKDARQISSSPPSMTLHGIRFQRAWCQGVVVSGPDEGIFLLDDGSGVVELSLQAEFMTLGWKSGMYIMVVGLYVAGDPPQIKVHKVVDLSAYPDRESLWHMEVIEAYNLFYSTEAEC
ncbi:uncharacterized protein LOC110097763 [Dendrobium catenatum]|uniref:RecQ-mediated genome instability protein 2 n=1 Tax=Dendrobium catenatum TaxID=906689 RepID=A0A2I0VTA2_9ASPA|nr:uncharacterized protein LOC110097763 [Dendrobium catenatum]PKU66631.1 hypothetical protein MA16_Dca022387 [Dendrobium catenatum]